MMRFLWFLVLCGIGITGFFFGAGLVRHHVVPPVVVELPWGKHGHGTDGGISAPLVDEGFRPSDGSHAPLVGAEKTRKER